MADSTTPIERIYKVFISSAFSDFAERKAAVEAVFERGHIPIALERFPPADESDLAVIEKAIKGSQIFILIQGHRYGELIPGEDKSYTEFEYDLAQKYGLMTLVFRKEPEVVAELRRALDSTKIKDNQEIANHERLSRFYNKTRKHFIQIFLPGPSFKYIVQLALADAVPNCKKPGYIPEPEDPAVLEGATNKLIGDLITEVQSFVTLYAQTRENPDKKRCVSQFFVQEYLERLLRKKVSLFFDSGSTLSFVAKEMSKDLAQAVTLSDTAEPSIQIGTNNLLVYLFLGLKIPCTIFPWSPPGEPTFGATYGGIEKLVERKPDYNMPPLDKSAQDEIVKLLQTPFTLTSYKKPTLLLGAAVGLQLTDNHSVFFTENDLSEAKKEELKAQISKCYGPYEKSYHNKIFKRFMYKTGLPILIFLTGEKIDSQIQAGKSHFSLDSEFTWEQFYRHHPLALCVGCSDEERKYAEVFRSLGFDVIEENSASPFSSFIARNAAFIEQFEQALQE